MQLEIDDYWEDIRPAPSKNPCIERVYENGDYLIFALFDENGVEVGERVQVEVPVDVKQLRVVFPKLEKRYCVTGCRGYLTKTAERSILNCTINHAIYTGAGITPVITINIDWDNTCINLMKLVMGHKGVLAAQGTNPYL